MLRPGHNLADIRQAGHGPRRRARRRRRPVPNLTVHIHPPAAPGAAREHSTNMGGSGSIRERSNRGERASSITDLHRRKHTRHRAAVPQLTLVVCTPAPRSPRCERRTRSNLRAAEIGGVAHGAEQGGYRPRGSCSIADLAVQIGSFYVQIGIHNRQPLRKAFYGISRFLATRLNYYLAYDRKFRELHHFASNSNLPNIRYGTNDQMLKKSVKCRSLGQGLLSKY